MGVEQKRITLTPWILFKPENTPNLGPILSYEIRASSSSPQYLKDECDELRLVCSGQSTHPHSLYNWHKGSTFEILPWMEVTGTRTRLGLYKSCCRPECGIRSGSKEKQKKHFYYHFITSEFEFPWIKSYWSVALLVSVSCSRKKLRILEFENLQIWNIVLTVIRSYRAAAGVIR